MISELKRLREDCSRILERLNVILPQIEDFEAPKCGLHPLEIEGICKNISTHAISRYRERTGAKKSDETIIKNLRIRLCNVNEMILKDKYRIIELLAHDAPARYFWEKGLMFIIENEIIVTVHTGTADRWIPKPATQTP